MRISEPDKAGISTGLIGAITAAWAYMSSIEWQISAIDPDQMATWMAGLFGIFFYTNRENRKKPSGEGGEKVIAHNKNMPLGIRLNNPGNLRPTGEKWNGLVGIYTNENGQYLEFSTPHYGVRAAARNLVNQQRIHNLRTIESILTKWAPASDKNHTAAYIAFVAQKSGFEATERLDLEDATTSAKLLRAIFRFENGMNFYSTDVIMDGIKAA